MLPQLFTWREGLTKIIEKGFQRIEMRRRYTNTHLEYEQIPQRTETTNDSPYAPNQTASFLF